MHKWIVVLLLVGTQSYISGWDDDATTIKILKTVKRNRERAGEWDKVKAHINSKPDAQVGVDHSEPAGADSWYIVRNGYNITVHSSHTELTRLSSFSPKGQAVREKDDYTECFVTTIDDHKAGIRVKTRHCLTTISLYQFLSEQFGHK